MGSLNIIGKKREVLEAAGVYISPNMDCLLLEKGRLFIVRERETAGDALINLIDLLPQELYYHLAKNNVNVGLEIIVPLVVLVLGL